jgi:hypothetical protein
MGWIGYKKRGREIVKMKNKAKNALGATLITAMLLTSGCSERVEETRGSLSPQEYFANRIRLEAGQPAVDIIPELYDELDFQRAVQVYVWATPFVAMSAMLEGLARDYGATLTRQPIFEQSVTPELVVFTGNNTTIYSFGHLDLKRHGPIVLEAPEGALGGIDNHWEYPLVDIGPFGPDQGKGGRFLVLPPDYEGEVPDGYFVVRSDTYQNFFLLRGVPRNGDVQGAVDVLRTARLYPLSAAADPPPMEWFNASGITASTTFPTDYRYFELLAKNLTAEPPRTQDKDMLGMLAPLGIVHGKPFEPDARVRGILERAAKVGNATSRTIAYNSRNPNRIYVEGSKWEFVFLTESATFETDSYRDVDASVTYAHQAFFTAEGMVQKVVGRGSQYLAAYKDGDGNWLDGGQSYSLHVAPNVPVEDFWSVMVYDAETRSMIVNDQVPGRDSNAELEINEDGSVDLYFGPEAPDGLESNWVKTIPGKGFFLYFRLYGPKEEFFDRSWQIDDLDKL